MYIQHFQKELTVMDKVKVVILAVFVAICIFLLSFAAVYAAVGEPQVKDINITEGSEIGDTEPAEVFPVYIEMHIGRTIKAETDIADGIWQSDNPEIAAVTSEGVIEGIKHGKCVITHTDSENPENVQIYNVTVKKRVYSRGSGYYSIKQYIELPSGSYNISRKNIGLKVIYVNRKMLGVSQAKYTDETYYAVKEFQKKYGLKATGNVNLKTWKAMGYSKKSWDNLGVYVTPVKIDGGSKKSDYINAMLDTAKEYAEAGTKYRIGCSGKPGTYADCSGLVYQCLYSAGINPKTNIVDHALAKYEYTSKWLAKDSRLGKTVSPDSRKIGDILFYGNPVYHVAIYAGKGYVYDSCPAFGVSKRKFDRPVSKVIRVFW